MFSEGLGGVELEAFLEDVRQCVAPRVIKRVKERAAKFKIDDAPIVTS